MLANTSKYSLEIPSEVEQTLNQIYKDREGSKNGKIKLQSKIKTLKDSIIYGLAFMKDQCKIYRKYLLEWAIWIDTDVDTQIRTLKREYKENGCDMELALLCELELQNGTCENIMNSIIKNIDDCIESLNNKEYDMFDFNFNCLNTKLNKLSILDSIYTNGCWGIYIDIPTTMDSMYKYEFICKLNIPLKNGLSSILYTNDSLKDLYKTADSGNIEFEFINGEWSFEI